MKKLFTKSVPNIEIMKKTAGDIFEELKGIEGPFSVFLEGGLGAGKTFLVRELLKLFGVKEDIVSPTYIYVNEYETENGKQFAHFDFYRMNGKNEFFEKGFQEISDDVSIACFVEWYDKISETAQASFNGKKMMIRVAFGTGVGMRKVSLFEV